MAIVEEECDESIYWMELIGEAGWMDEKRLNELKNEAIEILSTVKHQLKTRAGRREARAGGFAGLERQGRGAARCDRFVS